MLLSDWIFMAAAPPITAKTEADTRAAGEEMAAAAEAAYFGVSSRNFCRASEETELPSFLDDPLVASSLPFLIQRLTVSGFVWSSSAISFTLYDFIRFLSLQRLEHIIICSKRKDKCSNKVLIVVKVATLSVRREAGEESDFELLDGLWR